MKQFIIILLIMTGLVGCNSVDNRLDFLASLDSGDEAQGYQLRLGYCTLIMKNKTDFEQSQELIDRLIELHSYTEARYCIEYLMDKDGVNPGLQYRKAMCLRHEYQYSSALKSIQLALSLDDLQKFREEEELINMELKKWNRIMKLSSEMDSSASVDNQNERARHYIQLGQFQAALFDLRFALSLDSLATETNYLLGMTNFYQENYSQAANVFARLVQISKNTERSGIYRRYRQACLTLSDLLNQLEDSPGNPDNYLSLSRELSLLGEFRMAMEYIERGLDKVKGKHPGLMQAKVLVLLQSGKKTEARKALEALELSGFDADPKLKELFQ